MSLDEILRSLGLTTDEGQIWRSGWMLSEASFVPEKLFFLEPNFVRNTCKNLKMNDEVVKAFLKSIDMFKNNLALQRLAWHCHFLLFLSSEDHRDNVIKWPMLPIKLDKTTDMFYAVVFLSGLPYIQKLHHERGIPEDITFDTLSDLELWIQEYRKRYGRWGFDKMGWLRHHFSGRLFKLGRLQFVLSAFKFDFHVFRHLRDKQVIVLAGDKMRFRRDGQFDGINGVFDRQNGWTGKFKVNGSYVYGNPVSVQGQALRIDVKLPTSDWQQILWQGDPVLGVHIPATGPMPHSKCGKSFDQAVTFFDRYFPEYKYRAFDCISWFLDNQFEKYLPATSNIVRFMKEVYLIPVPNSSDTDTFQRVFGKKIDDLNKAPQETSLQRAIINHLKTGGHCRSGGCLLFPEDLDWGTQVYRKKENIEMLKLNSKKGVTNGKRLFSSKI